MRMYINGLVLVDEHFSGIGQYVLGIIRGLDDVAAQENQITVIVPFDKVSSINKFNFKNVHVKTFPLPFSIMVRLARRRLLPPLDLFYGRGVYVFPHFVNTPLLFSKSVLVIYDLSYVFYPQYSDDKNAAWLQKYVPRSLAHTDHIVTISDNAKGEIINYYNVPTDHIDVATPGVDTGLFYPKKNTDIRIIQKKYSLPPRYILSLSNLEPRKNLETLVDAYCALPKALQKEYPLLIAGLNGWKTDRLLEKIDRKIQQGHPIILPEQYITNEDRPAIFSGASLFVFPSHYEGFGMPPLEALACGTPVIAADNSSLPEVVGDVGQLVNAEDVGQLSHAIATTLNNIDIHREAAMKDGPKHASLFSWKKSAARYVKVATELDKGKTHEDED